MRALKQPTWTLFALVLAWQGAPTNGQGSAPLFDSIDEHFNPVSMVDMIDGKPLVLALSSCS
jgi:hypothetical protein